MTASVYARALDDRFEALHPEIRRWFGDTGPAAARGTFDEVGCRHRWLRPALAVSARLGLLFPEHGRGVPFEVTVRPVGASTVATRRVLQFDSGERVLADSTRLARGRLIDAHAGGRLQVEMIPEVADGALVAHSARARLMIGRYPLPVPTPHVSLRHAWDPSLERHTIDVSVTVRGLGELFGYRGSFTQTAEP